MPSDYQRIREENLWKYGHETNHLAFLGQLYTERTHFLLELLQNAEDAASRSDDPGSPKEVRFELFPDRLELRHNGRPFDEQDVRGICGVGDGTKTKDLTQIGKFGIGFKSVYAYTTCPEIHSGEEYFRIEHYVRPFVADQRAPGDGWTTLFVFPFNYPDVKPGQAFDEIARRLKALSARTLLFLRHVQAIHWKVEGGGCGSYRRDAGDSEQVRRVQVMDQDGKTTDAEEWLVFEKPLSVRDKDGKDKTVWYEVAFRLHRNMETGEKTIARVHDSHLVVFFPTEKETHLGFLVQGPYKTTPARDNIPKDDDWNRQLIHLTARLVAETLPILRDRNLLTVSLLEALPIRSEEFLPENMFRPVFERVREALKTQNLLPTHGGTFVPAVQAKLARGAALRKLLSDEQLGDLLGTAAAHWLADGVTHDRTPELWSYLREELQAQEITPASFLGLVTPAFLDRQPDEWMARFYVFLDQHRALWSHGCPLRSRPFIRCEDGIHAPAFRDDGLPEVYLPPEEETSFRIVKRSIAVNSGALSFLNALGLKKPDIIAEVRERILPKYDLLQSAAGQNVGGPGATSNEENWQDIRKILRAVREASYADRQAIEEEILNRAWVRAKTADDGIYIYFFPNWVYMPSPELEIYFEGNSATCFLSDNYTREQRDEFGKLQWLSEQVRVTRREADYHGYVDVTHEYGRHERGVGGFDPNFEIDGLEHALKNITREKAVFIWNHLLIPNWQSVRGVVESSTRQTFADPRPEERLSPVGELVTKLSWLPDRAGSFHPPADLLLEELPDEFERSADLALALSMRSPPELGRIARDLGVKEEDIDFLRKNPVACAQFRKEFEESQARKRAQDHIVKSTGAPDEPTTQDEPEAPPNGKPPTGPGKSRKPQDKPDRILKPTRRPVTRGQVKSRLGTRIDPVRSFQEGIEEVLKREGKDAQPSEKDLQPPDSSKAPTATELTVADWQAKEIDSLFIRCPPRCFGIRHFVGGWAKRDNDDWRPYVKDYLSSARAYDGFLKNLKNNPEGRHGLPLNSHLKRACQIEKDEKFWLAGALLRCFYSEDRQKSFAKLLSLCEHALPPKQLGTWEGCLSGDPCKIYLFFEVPLPSPHGYGEWLQGELYHRQVVPYVIYAGHDCKTRKVGINLEGTTKVDALLLNANNGFSVLFEAKVLSDISGQVTYDGTRNQIARNIDAMLYQDDNPDNPVHLRGRRKPDFSCFVLLTPGLFKDYPHSRLYGLLLPEYQKDPSTLRRDIPSRPRAKELPDDVATRIDWLTWEAIHDAVRNDAGEGICPWLNHFKYGQL